MQDIKLPTILLTSAKWSNLAQVLSVKWMTSCLPVTLAILWHKMVTLANSKLRLRRLTLQYRHAERNL